MRYFVEPWSPSFGSAQEFDEGAPDLDSSAELDLDVELPRDSWRPIAPAADATPPPTVLLVDGVRRVDAYLWIEDCDGFHPAVAMSYAAGVVRCDLARGAAELALCQVRRGLFSAAPGATALGLGPATYLPQPARGGQHEDLVRAAQGAMLALEVTVSEQVRLATMDGGEAGVDDANAGVDGDDDLLITDGPLRGRQRLPRALGYVKTHSTRYLQPAQAKVVTASRAGQRSPVFFIGPRWPHYSWYLRLPGPAGAPGTGIVRLQCSPELTRQQAIELADRSAVTLPRFASSPYKDPRAPQNLVPIAGLERRLRSLLGDPKLLHRTLVKAA